MSFLRGELLSTSPPSGLSCQEKTRETHVPRIKEEICCMVDKYKPALMNSWHCSVFRLKICADRNWHVNKNHHYILLEKHIGYLMHVSSSVAVVCHACFGLERMCQYCRNVVRRSWHSVKVKPAVFRSWWESVSLAALRVMELFSLLLRPKRGRHAKSVINDASALPASNQSHRDNKLSEYREKRWYYNNNQK